MRISARDEKEGLAKKNGPFPFGQPLYLQSECVCSDGAPVRARVCLCTLLRERETSIATLSGNYKFNVCGADVRVSRSFVRAKEVHTVVFDSAQHCSSNSTSQRTKSKFAKVR